MDSSKILNSATTWFNINMNNFIFNKSSDILATPSQEVKTSPKVNVEVLKQRLIDQKRRERVKRTIIFSTVVVSLGALTVLSY